MKISGIIAFTLIANSALAATCNEELKIPLGISIVIKPELIPGETQIENATAYAASLLRNLIAVGYDTGVIRLFDLDTGLQRTGSGGFLKHDTEPVTFLGFLQDDQILVVNHENSYKKMNVGYYFDIRTFFNPCLTQYGIVVGKVWGKSNYTLIKKLVVNNDQYSKKERWPLSPVPLKCGERSTK